MASDVRQICSKVPENSDLSDMFRLGPLSISALMAGALKGCFGQLSPNAEYGKCQVLTIKISSKNLSVSGWT